MYLIEEGLTPTEKPSKTNQLKTVHLLKQWPKTTAVNIINLQ